MSQVFYEDISFQDLCASATIIVGTIVSKEMRTVEYDDIADFGYEIFKIQVDEVLKGPITQGELIEVERATASYDQGAHAQYEREGITESPIHLKYSFGRPPKQAVFFLRDGSFVPFALVAIGSWESMDKLDEVKAHL